MRTLIGRDAPAALPKPGKPTPLGEFLASDTRFPAVYFLFNRGEVVYIGQSKTLRWRIDTHINQGVKVFDAVAFARCSVNQLTRVEAHYIREYAPKYNQCATTLKVRERAAWKAARNRDQISRDTRQDANLDLDNLGFVDAAECMIPANETGEFLGVAESDAAAWLKEGRMEDLSVLGLIHFVARNSCEVAAAQERYDSL